MSGASPGFTRFFCHRRAIGGRNPRPRWFGSRGAKAPGNLDDKALAEDAAAASGLRTIGRPALHKRDAQQNLTFAVFGPNGRRDITYLESEGKLRVEIKQNSVVEFLSASHAGSSRRGPPEWGARVWGIYNEFANWAFPIHER
ncbi:MAG: hypothetical protein U5J83_13510 [Bryobacterales bacterium]|nr:hypothetical protein [Bryobacterales bacterium]